jgi:hypothetical protein
MKKQMIIAGALGAILSGVVSAQAATSINFDQMKEACSNPARFHNQNAPKNIEVVCQDSLSKYVPSASGAIKLPVARTVTTSMASDKYSMAAQAADVKMSDSEFSCPKFTKIIENMSLSRRTTCEELLAFEGSATDFCLVQIEDLRASNPEAINMTTTQSVVSLCEKSEEGRDQRGQLPGNASRR